MGGESVADDLTLLLPNKLDRRLSLATSCESDEPESIDMARRWEEVDDEDGAGGAREESMEGRRLPKLKKPPLLVEEGRRVLFERSGVGEVEKEGGIRDETDDSVDPESVRERGRPPSKLPMDGA